MTQNTVRSYNPGLVTREHIKPITFIYGNDEPGIQLRISRFADILSESGDMPVIFPDASEAAGYLMTGDMFQEHICVVIRNISDMLATSADSKKLYAEIVQSLFTYGESSTIVIGCYSKNMTKNLTELISSLKQHGALCRSVMLPDIGQFDKWIEEYGKSINANFSENERRLLAEASDGSADAVKNIVAALGNELENLNAEEIREWMSADANEMQPSDIRNAILKGNIESLVSQRAKLATQSEYRMFLIKIRMAALDLMIAASSFGNCEPLQSFKAAAYGKTPNVANIVSSVSAPGAYARFSQIYKAAEDEIEYVSGARQSSSFDYLLFLISQNSQSSRKRRQHEKKASISSLASTK